MPFDVRIIVWLAGEIIEATFGLIFYYFLFRVLFQRAASKPKELRANEHVYYPKRFYVPISKIVCEYIAFVIIMVSFKLWIHDYWAGGRELMIIGVVYALIMAFLPLEKKVKRVIINAEGLTLEWRAGGSVRYAINQYVGEGVKCLCFDSPSGSVKRVSLRFLFWEDRNAVVQDVTLLKKTGRLTAVAATKEDEERRKANQQFMEEKQKLYADTKRYEAYLKEEASKRLASSQKQELVRMIQLDDRMNAIKQCREWTGLGLKEAKDVVDQYQRCLVEKEGADDVPAPVSIPEKVSDELKSDAEIRELDRKRCEEAEKWKTLQENPAQYNAFLRQASKQISENRRREIVRLAQKGAMVPAIKLFRDTTGLSLKVSHDLVTAYQTYLMEERKEVMTGNQGTFAWKWCITGKEQEYSEEKSLEGTLDQLLSDLSMKREEYVALIPPAPILGIVCVRACLDPQGIMYRAEVEFVEHDAQGNPKILYKNGLMSWDVRDVFVSFRRNAKVQTDGWQQVKGCHVHG